LTRSTGKEIEEFERKFADPQLITVSAPAPVEPPGTEQEPVVEPPDPNGEPLPNPSYTPDGGMPDPSSPPAQ
jgi:hypothetical protein